MKRTIQRITVLLVFILTYTAASSQNLALHKPYKLSVKPVNASNGQLLTDGKLVKNNYNKSKHTLRWKREKWVRIDIDLQQNSPIGQLVFNTVKGRYSFPENIFILISNDGKHYEYVGDAINGKQERNGISRSVISKPINRYARYVSLVVIPHGRYMFTDEISIMKGEAEKASIREDYTFDTLWRVAKQLKYKALSQQKNNDLAQAFSSKMPSKNTVNSIADNGVQQVTKSQIGGGYGSYLSARFQTPFVISKHNTWGDFPQVFTPQKNKKELIYHVATPLHGMQYGAFVLTNTSTHVQQFSLSENSDALTLYQSPYVFVSSGKQIADPLVPVSGTFKISPGFSKVFVFSVCGQGTGTQSYVINIKGTDGNKEISVINEIYDIDFPTDNDFKLSGNAYPYLQKVVFDDLKINSVVEDLQQHHNDVIPIRGAHYPGLKSTDFDGLREYLKHYSAIDYVLINQNYKSNGKRNGYQGGSFMSSEWKMYFKRWYSHLLKAVHDVQPKVQVLFYPYDEIHSEKDIEDFKQLIKWAKNSVPGIQFYATLNTVASIKQMLPYIDVAQIQPNKKIRESGVLNNLPKHRAKIWLYTAAGTLRSQSPYSFFRLKAWRAFELNATGIGFWNYAASIHSNTISSPPVNPYVDYSVIYTGDNGHVISSRRWEGFKLGIEDYEIIWLYAQKYGRQKALKLVKKVLDHPDNVNLADQVRNKMIIAL